MYASDVLKSLELLHTNNIIHCDIKPQNFLLYNKNNSIEEVFNEEINENEDNVSNDSFTTYEEPSILTPSLLKLTDFGLSHIIPSGEKYAFAKFSCGTHNYKAPELINVGLL